VPSSSARREMDQLYAAGTRPVGGVSARKDIRLPRPGRRSLPRGALMSKRCAGVPRAFSAGRSASRRTMCEECRIRGASRLKIEAIRRNPPSSATLLEATAPGRGAESLLPSVFKMMPQRLHRNDTDGAVVVPSMLACEPTYRVLRRKVGTPRRGPQGSLRQNEPTVPKLRRIGAQGSAGQTPAMAACRAARPAARRHTADKPWGRVKVNRRASPHRTPGNHGEQREVPRPTRTS